MASRVEFAVSITPIVTMTSTDAADHDSICSDTGKCLGGSKYINVGQEAHTTVGYAAGVPAYAPAAIVSGSRTQLGADATAYDMVYIKHTGYQYSSPTVLGAITSNNLNVFIEVVPSTDWIQIATIPPGGAIVLPSFPSQGSSLGLFVRSSSTETIAVEYALIT